MEIVTGYVEHIVFRNEENGYTVFQLESEAGEVTCVGTLNFISEGERLEIKGDYVNHNIYGSQLKISSYEMKEPEITLLNIIPTSGTITASLNAIL